MKMKYYTNEFLLNSLVYDCEINEISLIYKNGLRCIKTLCMKENKHNDISRLSDDDIYELLFKYRYQLRDRVG